MYTPEHLPLGGTAPSTGDEGKKLLEQFQPVNQDQQPTEINQEGPQCVHIAVKQNDNDDEKLKSVSEPN
jgi:hypothetical protein